MPQAAGHFVMLLTKPPNRRGPKHERSRHWLEGKARVSSARPGRSTDFRRRRVRKQDTADAGGGGRRRRAARGSPQRSPGRYPTRWNDAARILKPAPGAGRTCRGRPRSAAQIADREVIGPLASGAPAGVAIGPSRRSSAAGLPRASGHLRMVVHFGCRDCGNEARREET